MVTFSKSMTPEKNPTSYIRYVKFFSIYDSNDCGSTAASRQLDAPTGIAEVLEVNIRRDINEEGKNGRVRWYLLCFFKAAPQGSRHVGAKVVVPREYELK